MLSSEEDNVTDKSNSNRYDVVRGEILGAVFLLLFLNLSLIQQMHI